MKCYVDPPVGWKYGFPKVFDTEVDGVMREWLIKEGYPQREIDKYGENFHVRMWAYEPKEV
jgi:hypothetical protein